MTFMATTPAEAVFIDTNVLVYASRPSAPRFAVAREALASVEATGRTVWSSTRILREYLAVVTWPQAAAPALPMSIALDDRLLALLATYPAAGRQVHDANLVAAMLTHGVTRLITFNDGDFRRFANEIEIEVPSPS